jgi:hypothetical protein
VESQENGPGKLPLILISTYKRLISLKVFGTEPPAELLHSIPHSQSLSSMSDVRRIRRVDSFGSLMDDDTLSILSVGIVSSSTTKSKEDDNQPPTYISSPSSSGVHTPDSSLDFSSSPTHLRFGDIKPESRTPRNDIAEVDEEQSLMRDEFRVRRLRARRLERFFGVPALTFQRQLSPNSPRDHEATVSIPVPRPMKQPSVPSIASTTTSSEPRNNSSTELIRSRTSAESQLPSLAIQQQQQRSSPQHFHNSHSISTPTPFAPPKQQRVSSHSHSYSHVDIGVERGKRWPPLTSMVKDIDRDRVKTYIELVDETDAEQMREVMIRLRKLK